MRVDVVYALASRQHFAHLELPEGATLADALAAARSCADFPPLELAGLRFGVFGKLATPASLLADGDRVEIYRPLATDPKDARRSRAAKKTVKSAPSGRRS